MAEPPKLRADTSRVDKPVGSTPGSAPGETERPADSVPTPVGTFATLPMQFGRYEVRRKLGHGQMGAVYLAQDTELDRPVALKVARTSTTGSAKLLKRMEIEAKSAAKIDHPHVCKVYDFGEIDGIQFIAQQYIEGEDLKYYLKRRGQKREPDEAVRIVVQILRALEAAHEKGVIHRDLKPKNVMLNKRREPVIMDFGLARKTIASSDAGLTQGMSVGTPAYMSPEQANGKALGIDHRSDLYAVGVMLFEMLTGEWPFTGGAIEVMGKKCALEPPSPLALNPLLNPQLVAVCHKMIAKQKGDRYITCAESVAALEAIDLNAVIQPAPSIHTDVPLVRVDEASILDFSRDSSTVAASAIQRSSARSGKVNAGDFKTKRSNQTSSSQVLRRLTKRWNAKGLMVFWTIIGGACVCLLALAGILLIPKQSSTKQSLQFGGKAAGEERELVPGMKFRWCPPGAFYMGSLALENGRGNDEDLVHVTLTKGFWLGETELTQGQWRSLMPVAPWESKLGVKEGVNYAASNINHGALPGGQHQFDSAIEFCRRLTERERATGRLPTGWRYSLPTEAQWEYACRAGTTTKYHFGADDASLNDYGWFDKNARDKGENYAHPVGLKKPNGWGLHDMHGNVWEWCLDTYAAKLPGGRDPSWPLAAGLRVYRGGCWAREASCCRSASRGSKTPETRSVMMGFRVALVHSNE